MQFIKETLRDTMIHSVYTRVKRIYKRAIGKRLRLQDAKYDPQGLRRLGSPAAGWTFSHDDKLRGSYVISAGAGEDISFELELISEYGCKIILIDPTPKAIKHYEEIAKRFGQSNCIEYLKSGRQHPQAYNLVKVGKEDITLVKNALWNEITDIRFFCPPNPEHVSHSISNFQNDYDLSGDHIIVQATTITEICKIHEIKHIELIKLDIEGAEIEVIRDLLSGSLRPRQILVEFDELYNLNRFAKSRINQTIELLEMHNYELRYASGESDFLFLSKE